MTEISPGEISAFRQGVRRHRGEGCGSLSMMDCCLRAGMTEARTYRHGLIAALVVRPAPRCPYEEHFGDKLFACAEDAGHEGEHALVAAWTG